jgi:hypothetical protein
MANGKQALSKRPKMAERAKALRELHFPNVAQDLLWHRKSNDGFITVPRTLPLAMQAIDAKSKGQPSGHVLFCLWARSPDDPLLHIENPATYAAEAGFAGIRAVDTWRRRMKLLEKLRFISVKPGISDFQYVLLLNPNFILEYMRQNNAVQDLLYGRFVDRMAEIGAMGELENIRKILNSKEGV